MGDLHFRGNCAYEGLIYRTSGKSFITTTSKKVNKNVFWVFFLRIRKIFLYLHNNYPLGNPGKKKNLVK